MLFEKRREHNHSKKEGSELHRNSIHKKNQKFGKEYKYLFICTE